MQLGETIVYRVFAEANARRQKEIEKEFRTAYAGGKLSFAQYQQLQTTEKRAYRLHFGRPKSPVDVAADRKRKDRARARRKTARASRRANR